MQFDQTVIRLLFEMEQAVDIIEGLVDQQAMPDNSYVPGLERLKTVLDYERKRMGIEGKIVIMLPAELELEIQKRLDADPEYIRRMEKLFGKKDTNE